MIIVVVPVVVALLTVMVLSHHRRRRNRSSDTQRAENQKSFHVVELPVRMGHTTNHMPAL